MNTKKSIDSNVTTLNDLISNKFFKIPMFQRKYEWDKELINGLIEDTEKYIEEKDGFQNPFRYNIGSIFYYDEDDKKYSGYTSFIVDGQQRLTTIFLILNEIKIILKERKMKTNDMKEVEYLREFINEINDKLRGKRREKNSEGFGGKYEYRISRDWSKDKKFLEDIFEKEEIDTDNPFYNAKKIIREKFNDLIYKKDLKWLDIFYNTLMNDLEVIALKIEPQRNFGEKNYSMFFENLNLKVKKLNIIDLIKNYIYSSNWFIELKKDEKKYNDLIERFENLDKKIEQNIPKKNRDDQIEKYIKFYIQTNSLYQQLNRKKENWDLIGIYKIFKQLSNMGRTSEKIKFINDFLDFLDFIFTLKGIQKGELEKNTNKNVIKLLWLLEYYFNSFIMIFWKIFKLENISFDKRYDFLIKNINQNFAKYLDLIFSFTVRKILSGNEGSNNTYWNNLAIRLNEIKTFENFEKEIKKKIINKEIIKQRLHEEDVYDADIKNIENTIRIILFLINNKLEENKRTFDNFKKLNIEHIIPKVLNEKIEDDDEIFGDNNLFKWHSEIMQNFNEQSYKKFENNFDYIKFKQLNKPYKFLIKYYMNKIYNLTIVNYKLNSKNSTLPFNNKETRSFEEVEKTSSKNKDGLNNFKTKKEGFKYHNSLKINLPLTEYESFSKKEDLEKWGENLINKILEEI